MLLFLSLFVVGALLFYKKNRQDQVLLPSPTPKTAFVLIASPVSGKRDVVIDNLALDFVFNKEIDKNSVFIDTKPKTEVKFSFSQDGRTLFVFPVAEWIYDQEYTLSIQLNSIFGDNLEKEVSYSFTPVFPKDSDLDESQLIR